MKLIYFTLLLPLVFSCSQSISQVNPESEQEPAEKMSVIPDEIELHKAIFQDSIKDYSNLSEQEWKKILTAAEFNILREKGTERAFTGKYNTNKKSGMYHCKGCNTALFDSDTKFDSGTGWPSFYEIVGENVENVADNSYGMQRVEVVCATCKGHLGHVFEDGPKPTGLRYCINSLSLTFEATKKK
ncbi:MAG: peptide-methionine (R)-S-oxide reductase MsrB [Flavobacteriales bacterium]